MSEDEEKTDGPATLIMLVPPRTADGVAISQLGISGCWSALKVLGLQL